MGSRIPISALVLGLAGALPFVVLALAFAFGREMLLGFPVITSLIAYGAVILSFLGGVRWGAALTIDPAKQAVQFSLAVIPSLIGWIALLLPPVQGCAILLLAIMAQGMSDIALAQRRGLPPWYGKLRLLLTSVVTASLFVVLMAGYLSR